MHRKTAVVILLTLILVLCLTACGGGSEAEDTGFGIGDPVQVGDVVITMDAASVISHKAKITLTIENQGTTALTIDPEMSFTYYGDSTGSEVQLEIDPSCPDRLSGEIPAGGSLTGQVCVRSDPTLTWPIVVTFTYTGGETESGPATWTAEAEEL